MTTFTTSQISIVALFVESSCWGILLVTFALCLRALLTDKDGLKPLQAVNRPMLVVATLLLVFATWNLAINIFREVVIAGGGVSGDQLGVSSATELQRYILLTLQTLTGDAMLIYRCWIVYGRSYKVAATPTLLWLFAFGSAMAIDVYVGTSPQLLTDPSPPFEAAILTFWCTSIALNIMTTSFIVYRIQSVDRMRSKLSIERLDTMETRGQSTLSRVIRIVVESGLIYTTVAITTLATFASKNYGIYITSALEIQTVGIAFNLIIIRVNHHKDAPYAARVATHTIHFADSTQHSDRMGPEVGVSITREVSYDQAKDGYPLGHIASHKTDDRAMRPKVRIGRRTEV